MFTQTSAPFLGGAYREHLLPERKRKMMMMMMMMMVVVVVMVMKVT